MNNNAIRWRALLLALCALGFALMAFNSFLFYTGKHAAGGFAVASASKPYLQKVAVVASGSPAARSGLHRRDVLDIRPMKIEGHPTNIAIGGALALGLGLSMRFVHGKVEHFVDHVMFRKRREDERRRLIGQRTARDESAAIAQLAHSLAGALDVLATRADTSNVNATLDRIVSMPERLTPEVL